MKEWDGGGYLIGYFVFVNGKASGDSFIWSSLRWYGNDSDCLERKREKGEVFHFE